MKRSEINTILRDVDAFLERMRFHLPPWAHWSPEEWRARKVDAQEVIDRRLGWDITDFGAGKFSEFGLFLFTLRNGTLDALRAGHGKSYCEKILVCDPGQANPLHYHKTKTEDIINRGGADLITQVYGFAPTGGPEGGVAASDVTVVCDGIRRTVPAGGEIRLKPGESVTLVRYWWHRFWGDGGRVLMGEVSLVNDDQTDNFFREPIGRFPTIEEDQAPLHLLVNDYNLIP
jgi:D-lyxose ketol-isomerase